jgi:SAM-dependent methyltransferase
MSTDGIAYWNVQVMKRWKRTQSADEARDLETFWDGRAEAFNERTGQRSARDYDTALVHCIADKAKLQPTDTCLDLGCGTGSLALPLARRLKCVTACDISGQMLGYLEARARQAHQDNIVTRHGRWMDLVPSRDVGPHDIVISHRSLGLIACDRDGSPDFVTCIARMHHLTRRAAFIIPRAFGVPDDDEFRRLFPECTGGPAERFSDLTTLNLLHAMGLFPRLDYVPLRQVQQFHSIDDEVAAFRHFFQIDGLRQLKRLHEYLARYALRQDDQYSMRTVTRVMVMWWLKEC